MNKIYNQNSVYHDLILTRKKSWGWHAWLSLCILFLIGTTAFAQTAVIGTGTVSTADDGSDPLDDYYVNMRYQTVYTAAELSTAGLMPYNELTGLGFSVTELPGTLGDYTIKIGHTSQSNAVSHISSSLTTVRNAASYTPALTAAGAFDMLTFDANFVWNGVDNIVIDICTSGNPFDEPFGGIRASVLTNGSRSVRDDYDEVCGEETEDTNDNRPNVQFSYVAGTPPSCFAPSALVSSNVTTATATLSWTASSSTPTSGYDVYYSATNTAPVAETLPTLDNQMGVSAQATGLSASTTYYWWLRSDCGSGQSAWVSGGNFVTLCESVTSFPWTENFESVTVPNLPICWSANDANADNDKWISYITYGVGGSNAAGLYTDFNNGSNNDYLILPAMTLTGNQRLKFFVRARSTGEPNDYSVVLSTTGNQPADFTNVIKPLTSVSSITMTEIEPIDLSAYSGDVYIAVHVPSGGLDGYFLYVDNFTVEDNPACIAPTVLAASNVTYESADLSWTSGGTSFDIEWGAQGFAQSEGTMINGVSNNYNLSGLDPNTAYSFYVRNVCGGGNGNSTWSGPYAFYTGYCVPTGTSSSYRISGVSTTGGYTNISNLVNGTTLPFNNYTAMSVSQSPGESVTYTVNVPSSTGIKIWVDLNNNLVFDSNELVASHLTYSSTGVWTGTLAIPSELPLGDYRMRIRSQYYNYTFDACGAAQYGYGEAEDYTLSVVSPPSCFPPSALGASNIGFSSADLSWTSTGTNFEIEYGVQGFTQGSGLFETVTTTSLSLSSLNVGTNYSYFVRNLCGGGDGNSAWAGPFNFATVNKALVTWTEGFTTATLPSGWVNGGFTVSTTTAIAPGATTNYLYKNLWSSGLSANVQSIYVGELGTDNHLKFNYKLADYDFPYATPEAGSGNFIVEIQQFPSATWTELATVSNNGTAGWQEVSYDLAAYAGEVVKIRITGNWISGDYYLAFDDFSIAPLCPTGVWVGATSTAWSTASNWADNMVPQPCTEVTVNETNPLVISSDVEVASISVGANANVTVNGTLNVGDITVTTGGMLTVANDAAVLQTALATNSGMVTVKRNSTELFRQDYTLWSSPVSGQNLRAFSTQTLFNRFSSYDPTLGTNGNYLQEIVTVADMNTKTFGTAKGYLIRMPNNWVEIGSSNPAQPYLGSFTGTLNNGNVSIALSVANNKLNLVGNPYASPISIAAFFAANTNIDETLYFWRKKGSEYSIASGYATYTAMGIASADTDIDGTMPMNIQTGQGFFVVANSATPGNLVFNNTMRNNGTATFYKGANESTAEMHRFWLNLSDATNVVGQTLIGYRSGATESVDAGVDALYFNDSTTALTSLIDNAEYIIQGRSVPFVNTDIVPLGFKSDVAGSYTIALANFDGLFAENQDIFLKDNVTGTLNNLKVASYTFTTTEGVFNERFEVHYANTTLGTNNPVLAANTILIGVKDQQITINAGTVTMDKIELIDVTGRVIYMQDGVNATTTTLENVVSANQMLIVRISTKENGVVTQKIIF